MNRPEDDKKAPNTVHFLDVVPDFRLVAAWDLEEDHRFPVFFKGLLITYLVFKLIKRTAYITLCQHTS